MPRRLIIGILILLILGILGGTAVLIMQRMQSGATPEPTVNPSTPGSLQPANSGNQQVINPTGDDDGDGLPNSEESLWGTSTTNADTDGDGFKDGEEVRANHNPTIAGPSDTLPAGFKPGQNLQPLDVAATAPIAVDQYFASNLNLQGPTENLTEAYNSQYPESSRTPDTLSAFIQGQSIITTLPTPVDTAIQAQSADSPLLLRNYLDTVGNIKILSNQLLLKQALDDLMLNQDPSTMRAMAYAVQSEQKKLVEIQVPPSAVGLHKLLLGYSELLNATFMQISVYNEDSVKGLLGVRQLQTIDQKYYPLIIHELNRLQLLLPTTSQ